MEKAYCRWCGKELTPAPARFEGQDTYVGYYPCPDHNTAEYHGPFQATVSRPDLALHRDFLPEDRNSPIPKIQVYLYAIKQIEFEVEHTGPSCMIDKSCNTDCSSCFIERLLDLSYSNGKPLIAILDEEGNIITNLRPCKKF